MFKRIMFDIIGIVLVFMAPWWVTLIYGFFAVIMFPWYVEIIILGTLYDVIYGGGVIHWYQHIKHTEIFSIPLLVIEFIKNNVRRQ